MKIRKIKNNKKKRKKLSFKYEKIFEIVKNDYNK